MRVDTIMKGMYLLIIIPAFLFQTVFGQGEILFPGKTNPQEVKSGNDPFVIKCTLSEDTPGARYEWYDKNGARVATTNSQSHIYVRNYTALPSKSSGLRLHFNNIEEEDGGYYKCIAHVNQQSYENSIQIIVKASLKFSNCETQQAAVLGKSAHIRCTASAGGFSVTTNWEKGGSVLEGDAAGKYQFNASSLTIVNVTAEDAGVYRFVAMTLVDEEQKVVDINVTVLIAPKIIVPILSTEVLVGNKSTLYCKATGKPRPTISWFKDRSSNALTGTDRITVKQNNEAEKAEGVLEINNVMKEDGGRYQCAARNEASDKGLADEATTFINVTVLTPPTIANMTKTIGKAGESAELICEAHGNPTPNMMWRKEGVDRQFTEGSYEDISVSQQTNADAVNPGAKLTITFIELKKTDAANYSCIATSKAGSITKSVELIINFPPDFDAQETKTFYNWLDNNNANSILCIATGNPAPVIRWLKDDNQINNDDDFYSIATQPDATDPYKVTSKLNVTYNGQNEEVFGIYKCEATNMVNKAFQELTLKKAERPKKPSVNITETSATSFKFLLMDNHIEGPEVHSFTVEFKKHGSSDVPQKKEVAKEHRTDVDDSRKYTEIYLEGLSPSTEYDFTFYAKNAVGLGDPEEIQKTTSNISVPDKVDIRTPHFVSESTNINLEWTKPKDGGSDISKYKIEYRPVLIEFNTSSDFTKGYEHKPLADYKVADNITVTRLSITNLLPGTFYEVSVVAVNKVGAGIPSTKFIQTKPAEKIEATTELLSNLSTLAIIGICVGIFFILFIIVDVICLFKNDCGVLNSIRKKLGGSTRGGGYTVADEKDEKAELNEEKSNLLQPGEQTLDAVDETDKKPEGKEEEAELKEKQLEEDAELKEKHIDEDTELKEKHVEEDTKLKEKQIEEKTMKPDITKTEEPAQLESPISGQQNSTNKPAE